MNARPTTETDAEEIIITKGKPTHWVSQEFARRLERERDEWKAKYIQQNKDLGCELRDPNGTIWDHAKTLQSEVEHLKSQLTQTQGCVTISRNGYVQELERELAEAREEIKMLKTNLEISFRQTEQAVQDRAEEHKTITAQCDRLAEALKETISSYDVVTESIPSLCSDYVHNVIAPLLSDVKG